MSESGRGEQAFARAYLAQSIGQIGAFTFSKSGAAPALNAPHS